MRKYQLLYYPSDSSVEMVIVRFFLIFIFEINPMFLVKSPVASRHVIRLTLFIKSNMSLRGFPPYHQYYQNRL